jgi:heme/copper-type cytochrome/quinol oxidase subunit 2
MNNFENNKTPSKNDLGKTITAIAVVVVSIPVLGMLFYNVSMALSAFDSTSEYYVESNKKWVILVVFVALALAGMSYFLKKNK